VWWLSINISEHRAAYIFINPEDWGSTVLRNLCIQSPFYTAQ
jgi:hypothetical protein